MNVPEAMVAVLAPFAPVFSDHRVFATAQTLVWGTILAQGRRTVTAAVRAVGRAADPHFTNFHRVLNRARWSRVYACSRILLRLLLDAFVPVTSTVVVALDDLMERRHSGRLFGFGSYRDPVASSSTYPVPCFGLRWLVASVCVQIPGATRSWALPFLSTLILPPPPETTAANRKKKAKKKTTKPPPQEAATGTATGRAKAATRRLPTRRQRPKRKGLRSQRLSTAKQPFLAKSRTKQPAKPRRHKTTIDVAGQIVSMLARWLPNRRVVVVVDGAFLSYQLLRHALRMGIGLLTRGKWAMVLYEEPGPRAGGARGVAPSRGARQGSLRERYEDPRTEWRLVEVAWYGGRRKRLKVATGTGLWSNNNQKAIGVRWVMTQDPEPDPEKRMRPEVFVTTVVEVSAEQVIEGYGMRWSEEVTFEESRRHLGIETQRQWSELAVKRTTPALLGVFSLVTLCAVKQSGGEVPRQQAAWYRKKEVTFSDCLTYVRRQVWRERLVQALGARADDRTFSARDVEQLLDALPLSA